MAEELEAVISSDQLATQLDQHISMTQSVASSQVEPFSDPYMAVYAQRQSLGMLKNIHRGVIMMALPHINSYRVALNGLNGEWPCQVLSSDANHGLIGAHDVSMLQAQTPV